MNWRAFGVGAGGERSEKVKINEAGLVGCKLGVFKRGNGPAGVNGGLLGWV